MGYYINPTDMTKEEWLSKHGKLVAPIGPYTKHLDRLDGYHFVCLVDNGGFTAAGIAFCDEEKEVFAREDGRTKLWFLVKDTDLEEVTPEVKGRLQ